MDFKEHEQDHPSVERLPLVQSKPMMLMKKNYKCTSCNKKFKNETSLNYHSMFHTSEEKSPSIIEPPKYSKSLEKDAKIDIKPQIKHKIPQQCLFPVTVTLMMIQDIFH